MPESFTLRLPNITDYYGKPARVEVRLELRDKQGTTEVSLVGNLWTRSRRDPDTAGQISDILRQHYPTDARILRLCDLWERWHLNTMRAGSPAQEAAIREWRMSLPDPRRDDTYNAACQHLKSLGLYNDHGYTYGHAWLTEVAPADILAELRALFASEDR